MPTTPTYPGVYIEEVPSGVRTIVGVSTSVTAFIGYFPRGPLNSAVRVLSMGDFEREFGGLHRDSEASYAVQQFFLNGGTEAWVVRVVDAKKSKTLTKNASVVLQDAGKKDVFRVKAGSRIRGKSVENPGQWGSNLRLEVDYDTAKPAKSKEKLFNLTVIETAADDPSSVLRTETFRNLTMTKGEPNYALEVVNEGSQLIQLKAEASTNRPVATGTLGGGIAAGQIPDDKKKLTVKIGASSYDIEIDYGTSSKPKDLPSFRPYLEAAIRKATPKAKAQKSNPLLTGATVQLSPTYISTKPYQIRILAGRTGADDDSKTILTFSEHTTVTGSTTVKDDTATKLGLTTAATANVQQYSPTSGTVGFQSGAVAGEDGDALPDATALLGSESKKTGLYALRDVDLFNILCIPRAADLAATGASKVVSDALAFCKKRRAMMIVDIPVKTDGVTEMETWMSKNATLRHKNAAVYFPRPRIADPLNEYRLRSVGASGTIAGLWARTDADRGVWKAPAGTEASLRGVRELAYSLTDGENGVLNPLGINCLRTFKVYGNVCWGARTLKGSNVEASEWKYVPVRRLALFLEESLYRGTQWVVFEPNDEPLWSQIRLNVGAFLHGLFRQGAFQGQSKREAYFVKCDQETTTQTDRNQGIVNILVGFAPLKPAEFVIIKISQITGQIPT